MKREAGEPRLHPELHHCCNTVPRSPRWEVKGQLLKVPTKNTPIPSSLERIFVGNCVSSEEALQAPSTENPSVGCISAACVTSATCEPNLS